MNPTWLYVALVYFTAVWLARRAAIRLPWKIAVFFYLLALVFFFRPMTQPYVNVQVDCAHRLPPWRGHTQFLTAKNPIMNDVAQQIVPWAHQARESWRHGHLPLWNHLSGSGYPLLANGQSSAFSPLRILSLPLPLGYAFTAEAAWKLLIAMTFMWLYCRRRGYSELASAIGAISFGFCTFLIVWLHFPLVTAAAFVPAIFFQIDLLFERRTYPRFLFAIALWTSMLFSGHPETVSHTFFLALLYLAWVFLIERPLARPQAIRLAGTFAAAMVISGLLALPFLLPFAEAVKRSKRYQELRVQPNAIGYYSDVPSQIILLSPQFFGVIPDEYAWGPAHPESITGFAGFLGVAAWFGVALQVAIDRRWRSREAFFLAATLLVLGIMLAWPVVSTLFHALFKMAANARLRLFLCFLLAALAASLVDAIENGRTRAALGGLAIASVIILSLMTRTAFPDAWKHDTAMLALLPSITVIALATLAAATPLRSRKTALMILTVAVIAELWKIGRDWNPTLPATVMYPQTPLIAKMQELIAREPATNPVRTVGIGAMLFPNAQAVFGLEDIRAHDPMANGRYLGLLRVVTGYDTSDYFAKWQNLETRLLDYLNVKYIAVPAKAEVDDMERYSVAYDGKDGRVFANRDVLPRFFVSPNVVLEFNRDRFIQRLLAHEDWRHTAILRSLPVENDRMRSDLLAPRPASSPNATLQMLSARPTEYTMKVTAPRYTLIVSSIPSWPGWRVERNGTGVAPLEVNGAFLGFVVRPGVTTVRVRYDPLSFKAGAAVSVTTLAGLVAPLAGWRRRRGQ